MIIALQKEYYWLGMKKYVAEYLTRCLEYQQVKAEHQHPVGLLHPLPIPEWKWETIYMDFITGLPKSKRDNNSIMVVADNLSKSTHFIPVNQVVEDMLRSYVMQQPSKWEDYLHLVEFTYNNGYHRYLQMSPFEVLYRHKFRTPSSWGGLEDRSMPYPEILKEMEEMVKKVEQEGEILVELLNILDRREVTLWKRAITQVKVQWQHFGPDEAT
eukprot:PITA_28576